MDFNEARIYLQEVRLKFNKTMAKEMKEALEKADIALALAAREEKDITSVAIEQIMEERAQNGNLG